MSNSFDYRCPKCGSEDHIDITAKIDIRLTVDGSDADQSQNGDHEWDAESPAFCRGCDFAGHVRDFDPENLLSPTIDQLREIEDLITRQELSILDDKVVSLIGDVGFGQIADLLESLGLALRELLIDVDDEIEQRQTSGHDEYWADLQEKAEAGHAVLKQLRGLA